MKNITRNYESLYIVDSTLTDDQVEAIVAKYANVVAEQGGEVQAAGRWDKRRLAYEVAGHRDGIYVLMYFSGEPAVMSELDRLLRIADDVFRHLIVRIEPERIDTARLEQQSHVAEQAAVEVEEAGSETLAEDAGKEEPIEEATDEPLEGLVEEAPAEEQPEPVEEQEAETSPEEAPAAADAEKAEEIVAEEENDQPKQEEE
ncbi:MAG: 30S ribosomal protein S6 [Armatimonadetes bacterium RBG_16_58_9]|nr:MAG: 30S ribosomal protein S6 [Armatimonadetes bacterium RBG_16_58_9]